MGVTAAALILLLTGTVTAPDGSPIAGATVTAVVREAVTTTTGASGEFTFDALELPLDLVVSAPGFATTRMRVTASPVTITLLPRAADASVVVAAPGAPPGAVSLSRETLATAPAVTLDERLRTVAGFSLFRRSSSRYANPTTHGVTMRGLSASGASRGLVILDGIPLNDGFGGWVTWTRVPAGALDRIDVMSGASGDRFGSDALGGVISLQSAVPDRPTGSLSVEGGTSATYAIDATGGGRQGRVSWFGAAGGFRSDGTIPLEASAAGPVDRPADAEWWNAFGRVDVALPHGRWSISGLGGRDDRGNGTVLQRNRMSGYTLATSYVAAAAATTFSARASVSPNAFDQTFSAVASGRVSESLTSTQRIEGTTTRAAIELGRSASAGYGLVRATFSRASADFSEIRPTTATDVSLRDDADSVSAQAAWTGHRALTISAGVRQEWRAAPNDDAARDRAGVGRVALEWQATTLMTVRGSAATSHRWPTLNELARGFRVGALLTNPNPDLKPERARAFEGGVRLQRSMWTFGATAFASVVQDAIVNVTVTNTVRQRQNAGDAVARGLEVDGEWRPIARLRVRGSVQWVDATFDNATESILDGKRLPQVPAASGTVAADFSTARGAMSVVVRSTGHQFDDDRNTFRLASATQVDARAQATLGRAIVFGVVENVFDARVETGRTPLVSVAPGRAARVGVRVLFGDLRR